MSERKPFKERVEDYKEQLPEHPKAEEAFNELLNTGRSPKVALATIKYVVTEKTQSEVSELFDVTQVSVRNSLDLVCFIMDEHRAEVTGTAFGGERKT